MNLYSTYTQPSQPYSARQTRAAQNNAIADAQASADLRYNMKPLDRAGLSRGGAQALAAGLAAAQNLADGIARAYAIPRDDAMSNAVDSRQQESLGLQMQSLASQSQYADLLDRLQRQSTAQQSILGGLMGGSLDSFLGF